MAFVSIRRVIAVPLSRSLLAAVAKDKRRSRAPAVKFYGDKTTTYVA